LKKEEGFKFYGKEHLKARLDLVKNPQQIAFLCLLRLFAAASPVAWLQLDRAGSICVHPWFPTARLTRLNPSLSSD
jgi:hypothetical protein